MAWRAKSAKAVLKHAESVAAAEIEDYKRLAELWERYKGLEGAVEEQVLRDELV